jgi:trimethylamine--corrinoid protein Co-methyltransferase
MFASSKIPDAQAAYESVMTMLPAVHGRANFTLHAAGWLENGLSAGYEKFMLDCEILGMIHTFLDGLDLSEDSLAMESLLTVEPGGHHLGTPHTMERFTTAFYRSELFDYHEAERWMEEGSQDAYTRAHGKYIEALKSYQPPDIDPGIEEELLDFINRRKSEILG